MTGTYEQAVEVFTLYAASIHKWISTANVQSQPARLWTSAPLLPSLLPSQGLFSSVGQGVFRLYPRPLSAMPKRRDLMLFGVEVSNWKRRQQLPRIGKVRESLSHRDDSLGASWGILEAFQ